MSVEIEAARAAPSARTSAGAASRRSMSRHRAEHSIFRGAAAMVRGLPVSARLRFACGITGLYFFLFPSRRRILRNNLAGAFPEKSAGEIASIARQCRDSFAAAVLDFVESSELSMPEFLARTTVAGETHLAAARDRGRGVFLLSAHFGSWEIGALRAGLLGEPIASVVRPLDNPLLEGELARRRTRFGNQLIPKKEAAREILRAMRRNQTVAMLVDQNVLPQEAVFVPFFGRLAATTPSLAILQLKTDASVVPVFTWPVGRGHYRVEFEAPILAEDFPGTDRNDRVLQATARYMAVTEAAIRKEPAAWLWMHNRWRTRPPGP